MQWSSRASTAPALEAALDEAADAVGAELGVPPDLGIVFVSEHHASRYDRVPELLARRLGAHVLLGCAAGGVIGGGREIERTPGVSVTAAVLPDVGIVPFHLEPEGAPVAGTGRAAWESRLGLSADVEPHFLLLPDPFTLDAESLVAGLDHAFPTATKVGGLASGAREPGQNALYLEDRVYHAGAVGVALAGNLAIDTLVAQGCRPIGDPMFVTRSARNVVLELDGQRPLVLLQQLFERAAPAERALFEDSLFLGIVMTEQERYAQGDFLIRNLLGIDTERGAIVVGASVDPGTVVQFHLRDARTSREDLEAMLGRYQTERPGAAPAGTLLFSCLGRGRSLYGEADYDSAAFCRHLGPVPLGGFFCNGEIGPVQGRTYLHGYTSAFGLFRARG